MSSRSDAAWGDPRALWALLIEDEATGDMAELGEIAEHLYVDAAAERATSARLRAEVHSLSGQLRRERAARNVPGPG